MSDGEDTWRLSLEARVIALETALTALAVIKGRDARRALSAALDKAANSTPPDRDPVHRAAMQVALRALAENLRLLDSASDA